MKGKVLVFDPTNGGFIRAEDGNRYVLRSNSWRGERDPRVGEDVDFEVNGDEACDVYPLNETKSLQESVGDRFSDLAGTVSRIATDNQTIQKLLGNLKNISASLFAVVIICMCLPFLTVSCNDLPVVQMSGVEIVTGKTVTPPAFTGKTEPQQFPGDPKAALIFGAAALGIGASLAKHRQSSTAAAGIGAFGLVILLSIKSGIDSKIIEHGAGAAGFKADYGLGFWGSFLMFLSAACLNVWIHLNKKDRGNTL
jgi:hypothetical protein